MSDITDTESEAPVDEEPHRDRVAMGLLVTAGACALCCAIPLLSGLL